MENIKLVIGNGEMFIGKVVFDQDFGCEVLVDFFRIGLAPDGMALINDWEPFGVKPEQKPVIKILENYRVYTPIKKMLDEYIRVTTGIQVATKMPTKDKQPNLKLIQPWGCLWKILLEILLQHIKI